MKNSRTHRRATAAVAAALMCAGTVLTTGVTAHATGLPADISGGDQNTILSQTNTVRQGANQGPLSWDSGLAQGAQAWADNPASHAGGLRHDDNFNNGAENISSSGPTSATGQWASEKAAYDATTDHDTNSPGYYTWGHYYNMIVPGYSRVGCGAADGITVCRYA
ncbi:CAP domain-containing protein [Streptomyces sp. NPDC001443]